MYQAYMYHIDEDLLESRIESGPGVTYLYFKYNWYLSAYVLNMLYYCRIYLTLFSLKLITNCSIILGSTITSEIQNTTSPR